MSAALKPETTLKKSRSITLTLMASLAAACSDGRSRADADGTSFTAADTVRRCVDADQRVVAEEYCTQPRTTGGYYPYFFFFGGRTFAQGGGTYVAGGSRTMPAIRGPVTRGGIGSSARARAGVGA